MLLEKGADANFANSDGKQPLWLLLRTFYNQMLHTHSRCDFGPSERWNVRDTGICIKALAKSGVDFNVDDVDTLLIYWLRSVARRHEIELFIWDILESERLPKLTIKDIYGRTFAHLAPVIDSVALLDAYIEHNGDIDARGYYDRSSYNFLLEERDRLLKTPLQVACERKSYNVARALVSYGARLDVVDNKNNSALDLLLASGDASKCE